MPSLFDMFKTPATPTTTPAAAATPATPGSIPASAASATSAATPGTAANGTVPSGTDITDNTKSSLDAFSTLWDDPTTDSKEHQPLFTATREDMLAAAQKADFKSLITADQLKAISTGGEAAVEAFASALNSVAQNVYAQSAFATTKLIETAMNKNNANIRSEIPNIVKQHNVSDSLRSENPALSHKAVQPIISALESKLTVKFPNATASEIRTMATDYIKAFSEVMNPAKADPSANSKGKSSSNTDWTTFLE